MAGLNDLFDPQTWLAFAVYMWMAFGLLLVMVSRSAMARRVRNAEPGLNPFLHPERQPTYRLVRAYFYLYGLDANSGALIAGAGMMLSGVVVLMRLHDGLGA